MLAQSFYARPGALGECGKGVVEYGAKYGRWTHGGTNQRVIVGISPDRLLSLEADGNGTDG